MRNIALQLYSVRELAGKDLLGTLENVAAMNYQGVQFAGFFNHEAETVQQKMREVGLKAAGAHVQLQDLQEQLDATLRYHEKIDNSLIICPYLSEDLRSSRDGYLRVAESLNHIGKKMKASGFTLGYHNHDFEFELLNENGDTGFDILFENTDSDFVKIELDCFWATYSGLNPEEIIGKYKARCVSLHIKDMKIDGENKVSTEIGTGILDIASLIQTGKKNGVDWFVVEQEDFTTEPMVSAKENIRNLERVMRDI